MSLWRQIRLLMYKNWLLQKKKKCESIFLILLPLMFANMSYSSFSDAVVLKGPEYYEAENISSNWDNYQDNSTLGYAPKTLGSEKVMNNLLLKLRKMNPILAVSIEGFNSEKDLLYSLQGATNRMSVGFIFNISSRDDVLPKNLEVTLRPTWDSVSWTTYHTFSRSGQTNTPGPATRQYMVSGFLVLQSLFFQAVTQYWLQLSGKRYSEPSFRLLIKQLAFPVYSYGSAAEELRDSFCSSVFLSFFLSVIVFTKMVVYEKESQMKEYLSVIGLSPLAQRIAWFLTLCCYIVPTMTLYAMVLCLKLSSKGPVLFYSDGIILFLFLICHGIALCSFCFMITTMVQTTSNAAAVSCVLYFISNIPILFMSSQEESLSRVSKLAYSLSFNCAMALGLRSIGISELEGVGVHWSNIHAPATAEDNFSLLACLLMLLFDSAIHILIAWYLEHVYPGEFGIPKPFNFCCTKAYWSSQSSSMNADSVAKVPGSKYFEKEPTDKAVGIHINKLSKTFGSNVVVKGTSLNMYQGQITVLLGHNGAGKTVTMSMLTGFIPPTGGTAVINGCDVRTNLEGARRNLGVCPQHNILFDNLTVYEHLKLFAKVKNVGGPDLNLELEQIARKFDLSTAMNTRSKFLSGGQKRKLSVAIALLGSKVVILDEPTTGVDPAARRHLWTVLQEARQDTTMMLTTHYMDEADVLGDRIAIMAGGVVKCCGSSLFLKNLYSTGYRLIVVKHKNCSVAKLTRFVAAFIPNSELETVSNTEVTYFIPDSQSKNFPTLFRNLEKEKKILDIDSFGVSATTMEEVFLKVGAETADDDAETFEQNDKVEADSTLASRNMVVVKGPNCDSDTLTSTITSFFPGSAVAKATSTEIVYSVPEGEASRLEELFSDLQNKMNELGIESFQTLSEPRKSVMGNARHLSKILNDVTISPKDVPPSVADSNSRSFNAGYKKRTGLSLALSCMKAMFIKRAIYSWRKLISTLSLMAIPVLFVGLSLFISTFEFFTDEQFLSFDLSPFGETIIPCTDGIFPTSNKTNFVNMYAKQFGSAHKAEYFKLGKAATFDNYTLKIAEELSTPVYSRKIIIGMEVREQIPSGDDLYVAYYNGQPYHSQPISVNYLLNTILQSSLNATFSLQTAIHPLSVAAIDNKSKNSIISSFIINIFLSLSVPFMAILIVHFLIKEREIGAKHMQAVCGVRPLTYWLPNLFWDFLTCCLPILLIELLFVVYEISALVDDGRWAITLRVLVLYCWALLSSMYAFQFLFASPASGVVWAIIFNMGTGFMASSGISVLGIMINVKVINNGIVLCCVLLFPNYNLYMCIKGIFNYYFVAKICEEFQKYCVLGLVHKCCKDNCGQECVATSDSYIAWEAPGIGRFLLFMHLQGIMYFMIVVSIDYGVLNMARSMFDDPITGIIPDNSFDEEADVAAERTRITSTSLPRLFQTDSLLLVNLCKRFKDIVAVEQVCLGIPQHECFGLLGQNGAGKSTIFKMMTGTEMVTGGNVYLKGFDVKTQLHKVQSNMGYCPQFDALIVEMTGRETLTMYARVRGIPENKIAMVVENLAERFMITSHIDKYVSQYSGGTKRKVSTAVAIIGNPGFLFLDEPSSGMDPEAKRNLWNILSELRASGCTLVLTSHSMEECDALCTRLAIMVRGRFKCLGSPQHLKNKFGQGYTLVTKLATLEDGSSAPNKPVINFILSHFPGASVFDDHKGYIHFQVPDATINLADIFEIMETAKSTVKVMTYSVQQTSLEQVFLLFTMKKANSSAVNP